MAKLLLIEDDEIVVEILAGLAYRGHYVAWESTGPIGLNTARQGQWDMMIVDRLLPGFDRLHVLQNLRRDSQHTPALALSALGDLDERVRALRAGGGDYLAKSFVFEELWNYRFVPKSNLVDVHMGRLRRKLDSPGDEPLIHSVRGIGFTLDATP